MLDKNGNMARHELKSFQRIQASETKEQTLKSDSEQQTHVEEDDTAPICERPTGPGHVRFENPSS